MASSAPSPFAVSDDEAKARFEKYERSDPLPSVQPALLNSADVEEYVSLTGMVFPFNPDPGKGKLKSASYEVDFLGDLHFVDPASGYRKIKIEQGEKYALPKNSITFLFLATTFRLPDYMAARFNLRITHVHAGLLLGTGPLIDPGFAGRLLIPLHNLTSEEYWIEGGDGLIWVEFTKLSENARWRDSSGRTGTYRRFPPDKRYGEAEYYFRKAAQGRVNGSAKGEVRLASSSIPGEIQKATESAELAKQDAAASKKYVERLKNFGYVAIAGLIISAAAITFSVYSLVQDANKNVSDATKAISDYRTQEAYEKRISALEEGVRGLTERTEQLARPVATRNQNARERGAGPAAQDSQRKDAN